MRNTPITDDSLKVVGMLFIINDITERKRAEEELRRAKEQTEKSKNKIERVNLQLETTYKKLMETSHHAGMAEVATDVLHNVGNVLNSINVSATLITEKVMNSEMANLKKLADIMQEHAEDIGTFLTEDPQGKHIPAYLTEVSKHLTDEQAEIIDKLHSLTRYVEHVKEIVKMQQMYARVSGVEISTLLDDVIDDAIQINHAGLEHHGIKVIHDYAELGYISIDRQKVLQVLVNLINNAKYALKNKTDEKLLKIRFYKHGTDRIRIEVIDNGVGITKEDLKKIFRHGFTTKKHGHGFGLHSGALAAKELGGSLTVHSDGPERGATFTLELPLKSMETTQCKA
jgi:signal transduction histidine kinase